MITAVVRVISNGIMLDGFASATDRAGMMPAIDGHRIGCPRNAIRCPQSGTRESVSALGGHTAEAPRQDGVGAENGDSTQRKRRDEFGFRLSPAVLDQRDHLRAGNVFVDEPLRSHATVRRRCIRRRHAHAQRCRRGSRSRAFADADGQRLPSRLPRETALASAPRRRSSNRGQTERCALEPASPATRSIYLLD